MNRLKQIEINYIYFGFMLFNLSLIHAHSIFLLENMVTWPLLISVLFQCFWETCLIMTISYLIKSYCHRSLFYTFKALLCFFILAQIVDFILIRIMGNTVWYFLYLLSFETASNIIETLKASNVPSIAWLLGAIIITMILTTGVLFYHHTDRLLKRNKLKLSYKALTLLLTLPPLFLLVWDKVNLSHLPLSSYESFRQLVPFKTTFSAPPQVILNLPGPLKDLPQKICPTNTDSAQTKPPIFLFIIESLREDFITSEIAPNLASFRDENISFDVAVSGGNSSHNSWFTIFHSQCPLRFSNDHVGTTIENGSHAITTLKELGYKIHVYTATELSFFRMGSSIFGKDHMLADTFQEFPHNDTVPAHKSDLDALSALKNGPVPLDEEGHLHIVFLDSTHFDYSWPRDTMGDRFQPVDDSINYILTAFSKSTLESIKNRYRNAIYYVDSLLGELFNRPELKDAMIVVTGDHGEEFYEHGRIFHASNLCEEQIAVPLYYKFGQKTPALKEAASKISSHIDIFPTLIDHLTENAYINPLLEGESIFKEDRWPYTITSRYNCGQNPFQFCLHSLHGKAILQTQPYVNITQEKSFLILSAEDDFLPEANEALKYLFPSK